MLKNIGWNELLPVLYVHECIVIPVTSRRQKYTIVSPLRPTVVPVPGVVTAFGTQNARPLRTTEVWTRPPSIFICLSPRSLAQITWRVRTKPIWSARVSGTYLRKPGTYLCGMISIRHVAIREGLSYSAMVTQIAIACLLADIFKESWFIIISVIKIVLWSRVCIRNP